MRFFPFATALAFVAAAPSLRAQAVDGTLDLDWGSGGQRVIHFDQGASNMDVARAVVVDAQGRAIIVGTVTLPTTTRIGLVRLTADGSFDWGYGTDNNARAIIPVGGLAIEGAAAVVEGDGHVVVAGTRVVAGNDTSMVLCHVSDGGVGQAFEGSASACASVAFDLGGTGKDVANTILMQPDGRYVVAGSAATASGNALAVARFNHDGSLDTGFGTLGKTTFVPAGYKSLVGRQIVRLPDGSFGIAAAAVRNDDVEFGGVVHLGADGILDTDFGNAGLLRSPNAHENYAALGWDPVHANYVAVGTRASVDGDVGITRCITSNGLGTICPGGQVGDTHTVILGFDTQFSALLRESDGRWLVAGTVRATEGADGDAFVARLDRSLYLESVEFAAPAGFLAHDFGVPGLSDAGFAIAQAGPRVLVAGVSLATPNSSDLDYSVFAVGMDRIFQDGFQK
jgi:uncharacterized delta-60 repeat protein